MAIIITSVISAANGNDRHLAQLFKKVFKKMAESVMCEEILEIKIEENRRRKATKIDKSIEWSRETTKKFIHVVEEYPVLWDVRSMEYKDLTKRTAAWQRIAEIFENRIPYQQLKKKWQLLCQSFSKKLAESTETKSGQAPKKIIWEYWSAMEFMRQAKKHYRTASVSNLELPQTPDNIEFDIFQSEDLDTSCESQMLQNKSISMSQSTPVFVQGEAIRRKRFKPQTSTNKDQSNLQTETMSVIQKSMESIQSVASSIKNDDKFDEFGDYVASTLRQMPADFVERAMAELQLFMSTLNNEAASIRLQRARQTHQTVEELI